MAGRPPAVPTGPTGLASGPYVVQDLGPVMWGANAGNRAMFKVNGNAHFIQFYRRQTTWRDLFQFVDVDMAANTIRTLTATFGSPPVNTVVLHSNGKIYFSTSDPGYFLSYDPANGVVMTIRALADKGG
jgi:hypothetical protein